jgi:hypothetical protein
MLAWLQNPDPRHPCRLLQTPQSGGGSEFVPGELDTVGEVEEGGEFDPADLEEEGGQWGAMVEESAGGCWCWWEGRACAAGSWK